MSRAQQIRDAAIAAAHGESRYYPEPSDPTPNELAYLRAIECFKAGKQCAGWDHVEFGDLPLAQEAS